jgi:hypothetical protein
VTGRVKRTANGDWLAEKALKVVRTGLAPAQSFGCRRGALPFLHPGGYPRHAVSPSGKAKKLIFSLGTFLTAPCGAQVRIIARKPNRGIRLPKISMGFCFCECLPEAEHPAPAGGALLEMQVKVPFHLGTQPPNLNLVADEVDQRFTAFGCLTEIHGTFLLPSRPRGIDPLEYDLDVDMAVRDVETVQRINVGGPKPSSGDLVQAFFLNRQESSFSGCAVLGLVAGFSQDSSSRRN